MPSGAVEAQLGHVIKPDAGVVETPVSDVIIMRRRRVEALQVMRLLQEVVTEVSSLSLSLPRTPTPPPTPFAPGSPYDARPGIQRFRGTPTRGVHVQG